MLGRGVWRRVGPWRVGRDGAVVDDPPTPRVLAFKDLKGFLRTQDRAREVGVHYRLPLLDGQILEQPGRADPGVVEQEIQAPERALGLREKRADGLGIAHVGGNDQRPGTRGARLARHLLEGILAPAGERDMVPLSQQHEPDCPADPAPGAGHDRSFLVHVSLLMAVVNVADSLPPMRRPLETGATFPLSYSGRSSLAARGRRRAKSGRLPAWSAAECGRASGRPGGA